MEWINIETLVIEPNTKRTLNQILQKQASLDLENIPPIKIDGENRIIDGVKRYLVLLKLNFQKVPVVREQIGRKIHISLDLNNTILKEIAA